MWEVLGSLLIGCVVSGVLPLVNAELLVVAAAVAVPAVGLPLVVAASTVGQMVSKAVLFVLARRAPQHLPARARRRLDRAVSAISHRGGAAGSLVFASAAAGFPPFYGVSLAGGALGMRTATFLLNGTAGRALRFGALAWVAHYVGAAAAERWASDAWAALAALVTLVPGV